MTLNLKVFFPWMAATILALIVCGCQRKTQEKDLLTPTQTVQLFYELLEQVPASEAAKSDPETAKLRRELLHQATDLVAVDHLRAKAGRNALAMRAATTAVAVVIAAQTLMARPDLKRIYHTEIIEGEQTTVGFTLVAPQDKRSEHEIALVREQGTWRISRF